MMSDGCSRLELSDAGSRLLVGDITKTDLGAVTGEGRPLLGLECAHGRTQHRLSKGVVRSVTPVSGVLSHTLPVDEASDEVSVRSANKTSGEKT